MLDAGNAANNDVEVEGVSEASRAARKSPRRPGEFDSMTPAGTSILTQNIADSEVLNDVSQIGDVFCEFDRVSLTSMTPADLQPSAGMEGVSCGPGSCYPPRILVNTGQILVEYEEFDQ